MKILQRVRFQKNFFNVSDIEIKIFQRLRVWFENFTACQILDQLLNRRQILNWIF